jgi:hypothetical protein
MYWLDAQDHTGPARGKAPYVQKPDDYTVYRNAVTDNGAVNNGSGDQSRSIQYSVLPTTVIVLW